MVVRRSEDQHGLVRCYSYQRVQEGRTQDWSVLSNSIEISMRNIGLTWKKHDVSTHCFWINRQREGVNPMKYADCFFPQQPANLRDRRRQAIFAVRSVLQVDAATLAE
jgi:hypothetical protein